MSQSPCSVPDWLRAIIPLETPAQQAACRKHDERYAVGGNHRRRLYTDLRFAIELLDADMEPDMAERYYWAVRMYGGSHWKGGDRAGAAPLDPTETPEAP